MSQKKIKLRVFSGSRHAKFQFNMGLFCSKNTPIFNKKKGTLRFSTTSNSQIIILIICFVHICK